MVIAHQTPVTPIFEPRNIAKGILIVLNVILIIAGGEVLPNPLNIP